MFSETPEKTIKIVKTCVLYASFLGLGMVMAIPGPTLVDLQHKTDTDDKVMGYLLFGRASGSALGTVGAGFLFDRFNRQICYGIAVLLMGIGTLGLPWWTTIPPMAAFIGLAGIGIGGIFGSGSVWCLDLWGDSSQPYLQALYFFYGIGNFMAPWISVTFLAFHDDGTNSTSSEISNVPYPNDGLYVVIPYLIVGATVVVVSIAIIIVSILFPKDASREALMDEELIVAEKSKRPAKLVRAHKAYLIILAFAFLIIYCGMEAIFGLQLGTFIVKSDIFSNNVAKSIGAYMTSVFWGSFVITRGLSVFWTLKLSPRVILFVNVLILIIASTLLVSFGNSKLVLWIGASLTGVGMSSIMPSLYNWVELHVPITNRVASLFNLAGAAGSAVFPLVVGQFIESYSQFLFHMMLGGSVALMVLYCIIISFISRVMKLREALKVELSMSDPFSFTQT